MVLRKKVIVDAATGKESSIEVEQPEEIYSPIKGIDLSKLKSVLKNKGIIQSEAEIE